MVIPSVGALTFMILVKFLLQPLMSIGEPSSDTCLRMKREVF
jgi:hypothetical protein